MSLAGGNCVVAMWGYTSMSIIILILFYFRTADCSGCKDASGARLYFTVVFSDRVIVDWVASEAGRGGNPGYKAKR